MPAQLHQVATPSANGQTTPQRATRSSALKVFDALQKIAAQTYLEINCDLEKTKALDPDWFAMYEANPPETASGEMLMELLTGAPNAFAKGLIAGTLNFRIEIAAISGRRF